MLFQKEIKLWSKHQSPSIIFVTETSHLAVGSYHHIFRNEIKSYMYLLADMKAI